MSCVKGCKCDCKQSSSGVRQPHHETYNHALETVLDAFLGLIESLYEKYYGMRLGAYGKKEVTKILSRKLEGWK